MVEIGNVVEKKVNQIIFLYKNLKKECWHKVKPQHKLTGGMKDLYQKLVRSSNNLRNGLNQSMQERAYKNGIT